MDILIVEDEKLAAERLSHLVKSLLPEAQIVGCLERVDETLQWLLANPTPDLGLFDIQLADGLSFEIFEHCNPSFPIIFTTAFDEYALKAFKVNSIDYLLKPIDEEELRFALNKFEALKKLPTNTVPPSLNAFENVVKMLTRKYKTRFLVRVGDHYRNVASQQIACFYSLSKATFFTTMDGKNLDVDNTLEELEKNLDPAMFFRVNRQFIVNISAINDIIHYSNSRLKLKLLIASDEVIIVSREKVAAFKEWLNE
jgi:DNA-binding LytR/AlgR family response regulator